MNDIEFPLIAKHAALKQALKDSGAKGDMAWTELTPALADLIEMTYKNESGWDARIILSLVFEWRRMKTSREYLMGIIDKAQAALRDDAPEAHDAD